VFIAHAGPDQPDGRSGCRFARPEIKFRSGDENLDDDCPSLAVRAAEAARVSIDARCSSVVIAREKSVPESVLNAPSDLAVSVERQPGTACPNASLP